MEVGREVEDGEVAGVGEAELKDRCDPGAVEGAEGLELGEGAVGALVPGASDLEGGGLCGVLHVADEEGGALRARAEGGFDAVASGEESIHVCAPLGDKNRWQNKVFARQNQAWGLFCHVFCRPAEWWEVVRVVIGGGGVWLVWRLLWGCGRCVLAKMLWWRCA